MEQLTFEKLLSLFDNTVHERLRELSKREDVAGFVVFENRQMDASSYGKRTAMIVGENCTYKTVEECEGKWLNDLPSQRQYATAYWKKGEGGKPTANMT